MDPEQRLLVILEYLAVEVQILFLGALVGMLGPQRLCLVDQFGTLSDLQLLGFFCCLIPTIERELADVNAAAREMAAELGRIGADSLVEGSPCRS